MTWCTPAASRDTSSSVVAKLVIQRTVLACESQIQKNDQFCSGAMTRDGTRENAVGLRRTHHFDGRHVAERGCELPWRWRVERVQPEIIGEQGVELRRDEPHLRRELTGLFAGKPRSASQVRTKKHDGFSIQQPVPRAAEGEQVYAAPACLGAARLEYARESSPPTRLCSWFPITISSLRVPGSKSRAALRDLHLGYIR